MTNRFQDEALTRCSVLSLQMLEINTTPVETLRLVCMVVNTQTHRKEAVPTHLWISGKLNAQRSLHTSINLQQQLLHRSKLKSVFKHYSIKTAFHSEDEQQSYLIISRCDHLYECRGFGSLLVCSIQLCVNIRPQSSREWTSQRCSEKLPNSHKRSTSDSLCGKLHLNKPQDVQNDVLWTGKPIMHSDRFGENQTQLWQADVFQSQM